MLGATCPFCNRQIELIVNLKIAKALGLTVPNTGWRPPDAAIE
jgi:hypothetical protein